MEIKITDNVYSEFVKNSRNIENSPVRDEKKGFWDIFDEKESDISQNTMFMNFLANINTEIPA
ncbi:MAG: hypothetical protein FWE23_05315 [Chitinivibrionia bacterium]|nr:hypothetical protein [Chitinivibrionia bacterium]